MTWHSFISNTGFFGLFYGWGLLFWVASFSSPLFVILSGNKYICSYGRKETGTGYHARCSGLYKILV